MRCQYTACEKPKEHLCCTSEPRLDTNEDFTAEEEELRKPGRWLAAPPSIELPSGEKVSRAEMKRWQAQRRDDASKVSSCCDACFYTADWLHGDKEVANPKTSEDGNQPEHIPTGKEKDLATSQRQKT